MIYNDKEFLEYLNFVKSSLNEIYTVMEQINFEYDEFYNFASIKRMITYIIDRPEKYFHYSSFILVLLKNFNELIIKNRQKENYKEAYEKFDNLLYEQEDYFYIEIFDPNPKYNDAIDKVTNVLG